MPPRTDSSTTKRAGLAGAGGGTSLVAVAQSLGAGNNLKPLLLWIAPSASVAFGTLGFYLQVEAQRLWRRRVVRRTRKAVEAFLSNPLISQERKETVRAQWETAEQSLTLEEIDRISVDLAPRQPRRRARKEPRQQATSENDVDQGGNNGDSDSSTEEAQQASEKPT